MKPRRLVVTVARGGSDFFECPPFCETAGAKGGNGGDAGAGATTTIVSGPAEAGATATGGGGGYGGALMRALTRAVGMEGSQGRRPRPLRDREVLRLRLQRMVVTAAVRTAVSTRLEVWAATPAPAAPPQPRVLATRRPLRAPPAVQPDIPSFRPVSSYARQRHCDSRCVGDRRREGHCHGGRGGGRSKHQCRFFSSPDRERNVVRRDRKRRDG